LAWDARMLDDDQLAHVLQAARRLLASR
jgi:hypothetical protein